jgi:hypothetical protein
MSEDAKTPLPMLPKPPSAGPDISSALPSKSMRPTGTVASDFIEFRIPPRIVRPDKKSAQEMTVNGKQPSKSELQQIVGGVGIFFGELFRVLSVDNEKMSEEQKLLRTLQAAAHIYSAFDFQWQESARLQFLITTLEDRFDRVPASAQRAPWQKRATLLLATKARSACIEISTGRELGAEEEARRQMLTDLVARFPKDFDLSGEFPMKSGDLTHDLLLGRRQDPKRWAKSLETWKGRFTAAGEARTGSAAKIPADALTLYVRLSDRLQSARAAGLAELEAAYEAFIEHAAFQIRMSRVEA